MQRLAFVAEMCENMYDSAVSTIDTRRSNSIRHPSVFPLCSIPHILTSISYPHIPFVSRTSIAGEPSRYGLLLPALHLAKRLHSLSGTFLGLLHQPRNLLEPVSSISLPLYPISKPVREKKNNANRRTYPSLPASPIHSYNHPSLVVTTAPSHLSLSNATPRSPSWQLLTPSASTYTLCPSASKSRAVCVTQICVSMPTMATW